MKAKLFLSGITKFVLGVLLVGTILFISAGSFYYSNAWLFMALLFIPMFMAGIILIFKNPQLLKSRLDVKENEKEQKLVILYSGFMFLSGFIIAGLNYRFSWIIMPKYIVIIASFLFMIAYILYAEVLRENTYLSRTIEVQKEQKVVDSGLYSVVRHPMYSASLMLFLTMPLILGSIISFIIFLIYPFIISKRIKYEEEVLERELKGYKEYKKKVKYKLIPFIW
ncbi:MAG: isoprenylcysteine carboxylmethyltransferase family protein [Bacilli bacterium]|nr:isoprenylcysteine carboxylmethyltransferase family protein [Bacilli bacterium]